MKHALFILSFLSLSVLVSASPQINSVIELKGYECTISTQTESIFIAQFLFKQEMSITMTDECGRTWTITATCGGCTNEQLNDAIMEY